MIISCKSSFVVGNLFAVDFDLCCHLLNRDAYGIGPLLIISFNFCRRCVSFAELSLWLGAAAAAALCNADARFVV